MFEFLKLPVTGLHQKIYEDEFSAQIISL